MKRIPLILASLVTALTSCRHTADTAHLGALADIAITYAAGRGVISPADVDAIRGAKTIILPAETIAVAPAK